MKLLLDTHIFIWWAHQPEKLSPTVLFCSQGWRQRIALERRQFESQQEIDDFRTRPVALTDCSGTRRLTGSPQRPL